MQFYKYISFLDVYEKVPKYWFSFFYFFSKQLFYKGVKLKGQTLEIWNNYWG